MNFADYFLYDSETGDLIWKVTNSNIAVAGSKAGVRSKWSVYIRVGLNRKYYQAHRIIWEMHFGPIPEGMVIDHIDGDPVNNVLSNLRLTNVKNNSRNKKLGKTNKTGFKGVSKTKDGRYYASIKVDGRSFYLGYFTTPEIAHEAYKAAADKYFGEFSRHK